MIKTAIEFIRLRNDDDPRATREAADMSTWSDIIKHHPEYNEWVAHNKTVPLAILKLLAHDANPAVRCAVAMRRKCDHALFAQLAHDTEDFVRACIARNPKAPPDVVDFLRGDPSPLVIDAIRKRIA